ncbi:hypothetical protein L3Q82_020998 [Scortum barcoo]|uniref:Uncharacterized protein n=1 Tax=Scortum barcoo TaxID=214431 RepID=A0ACB8V921_9TELE|nr:hypothetical protein L3Q82_020998 [Scortum barcoo]
MTAALLPPCRLRRLNMDRLCNFYRCTIESILTGCITAWNSSCTALNRKALRLYRGSKLQQRWAEITHQLKTCETCPHLRAPQSGKTWKTQLTQQNDDGLERRLHKLEQQADEIIEELRKLPEKPDSQPVTLRLSGTMTSHKDNCLTHLQQQLSNIDDALHELSQQDEEDQVQHPNKCEWFDEQLAKKTHKQKKLLQKPPKLSPRRLRSGTQLPSRDNCCDSGEDENLIDLSSDPVHSMCPIMTKSNGQRQYVPWSFCDMIRHADRLPDLTEGANKWITALEESTAGITLALGDIKGTAHAHYRKTLYRRNPSLIGGNTADPVGFNGHRNQSTIIQYMDDILIASPTKEQCEQDSITVLTALAKGRTQSQQRQTSILPRRGGVPAWSQFTTPRGRTTDACPRPIHAMDEPADTSSTISTTSTAVESIPVLATTFGAPVESIPILAAQPSEPSTSWQPGPAVEQPPPPAKNEPDPFLMFPGGCSQPMIPPRQRPSACEFKPQPDVFLSSDLPLPLPAPQDDGSIPGTPLAPLSPPPPAPLPSALSPVTSTQQPTARRRLTFREVGDLPRHEFVRLHDTLYMEDRLLLQVVRHGLKKCRGDLRKKPDTQLARGRLKDLRIVENRFSVVLPKYTGPPDPPNPPGPLA